MSKKGNTGAVTFASLRQRLKDVLKQVPYGDPMGPAKGEMKDKKHKTVSKASGKTHEYNVEILWSKGHLWTREQMAEVTRIFGLTLKLLAEVKREGYEERAATHIRAVEGCWTTHLGHHRVTFEYDWKDDTLDRRSPVDVFDAMDDAASCLEQNLAGLAIEFPDATLRATKSFTLNPDKEWAGPFTMKRIAEILSKTFGQNISPKMVRDKYWQLFGIVAETRKKHYVCLDKVDDENLKFAFKSASSPAHPQKNLTHSAAIR